MKMVNDVCWLVSGLCNGIGEIIIFENEFGFSIMFGKVNFIQSEVMMMVVICVFGNDVIVVFVGSQGNFQLNVFKLVMVYVVLESICLIFDVCLVFNDYCVVGIQFNEVKIKENFDKNLMQVIVFNCYIGYDKVVVIVKKVYKEGISFKDVVLVLGYVIEDEFVQWVVLLGMIYN